MGLPEVQLQLMLVRFTIVPLGFFSQLDTIPMLLQDSSTVQIGALLLDMVNSFWVGAVEKALPASNLFSGWLFAGKQVSILRCVQRHALQLIEEVYAFRVCCLPCLKIGKKLIAWCSSKICRKAGIIDRDYILWGCYAHKKDLEVGMLSNFVTRRVFKICSRIRSYTLGSNCNSHDSYNFTPAELNQKNKDKKAEFLAKLHYEPALKHLNVHFYDFDTKAVPTEENV